MSPRPEHDHPPLQQLLQQRLDTGPSASPADRPQCSRCDLLDRVIEDQESAVFRHGRRTPQLWIASKQAVRSGAVIPMDGSLATVNLRGRTVSIVMPKPVNGLLYVSFWACCEQETRATCEELHFPVQANGRCEAQVDLDCSRSADVVAVIGVLPQECAHEMNNADLDLVQNLMARLLRQGDLTRACQLMKWARQALDQLT